jgi:hypothetical protein
MGRFLNKWRIFPLVVVGATVTVGRPREGGLKECK